MTVAQQYVEAFGKIAQKGTTMIVPADASNVASMVAQATSVFQNTAKAPRRSSTGEGESSADAPSSSSIGFQSVNESTEQAKRDRETPSSDMSSVASSPILQRRADSHSGGSVAHADQHAARGRGTPMFSLQR
jgi:hypothetical protein